MSKSLKNSAQGVGIEQSDSSGHENNMAKRKIGINRYPSGKMRAISNFMIRYMAKKNSDICMNFPFGSGRKTRLI